MKLALDEHYSPHIARQLRDRGHDAVAVDDLAGLPDETLLHATSREARALVTNNVEDFVAVAREFAAAGEAHGGLVFTADRSLPRTRAGIGRLVAALEALLVGHPAEEALRDQVIWLSPAST